MNNKSKKNSLYIYNKSNKSKKYIDNREYSRQEFNSQFVNDHDLERRFRKINNCNLFIMFDPDAPNGEGNSGNEVYIHYLKIINNNKNVIYYSYKPPTPPKGTHNYYALSIKLDNNKILDLINLLQSNNIISKSNKNDRTHQFFQKLNNFLPDGKMKKFQIGNISVNVDEILFHNHFKVRSS